MQLEELIKTFGVLPLARGEVAAISFQGRVGCGKRPTHRPTAKQTEGQSSLEVHTPSVHIPSDRKKQAVGLKRDNPFELQRCFGTRFPSPTKFFRAVTQ
jgi:hypothetical protein